MHDNHPQIPSPSSLERYEIVPLRIEHVQAMALSHVTCFPGYFLTSLGLPFVELFYSALAMSDLCVAVVAIDRGGKVLSFAAGATTSDDFRRYFYRHFFFRTTWALIVGFCKEKQVRYYLINQRYRLKGAIRLLIEGKMSPSESSIPKRTEVNVGNALNAYTLMSMGTLPECRGSKLASEIISAFESTVSKHGGNAVKTSTGKDNQRAISFYRKNGYEIYRDTRPDGVDLIKLLDA